MTRLAFIHTSVVVLSTLGCGSSDETGPPKSESDAVNDTRQSSKPDNEGTQPAMSDPVKPTQVTPTPTSIPDPNPATTVETPPKQLAAPKTTPSNNGEKGEAGQSAYSLVLSWEAGDTARVTDISQAPKLVFTKARPVRFGQVHVVMKLTFRNKIIAQTLGATITIPSDGKGAVNEEEVKWREQVQSTLEELDISSGLFEIQFALFEADGMGTREFAIKLVGRIRDLSNGKDASGQASNWVSLVYRVRE